MSEIMRRVLPAHGVQIDLGKIAAEPSKRIRRSVAVRLASANRALASMRMSERSERQMLQVAKENLQHTGYREGSMAPHFLPASVAALKLEVETHQSNVKTIETQVALVRLAIEHLHRRVQGWNGKAGEDGKQNDGPNEHLTRGFAAVQAIRALRAARSGARLNA